MSYGVLTVFVSDSVFTRFLQLRLFDASSKVRSQILKRSRGFRRCKSSALISFGWISFSRLNSSRADTNFKYLIAFLFMQLIFSPFCSGPVSSVKYPDSSTECYHSAKSNTETESYGTVSWWPVMCAGIFTITAPC